MVDYSIKKYDKLGRIIFYYECMFKTSYQYEYFENERTITAINNRNRSNFKTITKEIRIKESYIKKERVEYGDQFTIKTDYNNKGKERTVSKKSKKTQNIINVYSFWNKENKKILWFEEWEKKITLGFLVTYNNIKKFKKKLK